MYICSTPASLRKLGEIWNAIFGELQNYYLFHSTRDCCTVRARFFPSLEGVFRWTFKTAGTGVSGPSPHLHSHMGMSNVQRKTLSQKCEKPFMYKSCIHSKGERWMKFLQYNNIIRVSQEPKISVGFLTPFCGSQPKISATWWNMLLNANIFFNQLNPETRRRGGGAVRLWSNA